MLQQSVQITKVRCEAMPTGPRFQSIGNVTAITRTEDEALSVWWLGK
jgi:hypothetical protein